ncbi:VTT domain-containing protein [Aquabacterium sp.]|uniref:TVP38/TMEM64 family protein n=1 Tax=Aquabacterium sp. TaxID=1872578 RepID=UPI00248A7188|nr:VTT domain-containing protein [Aquabacterium sp.]MDI1259489.1 VTT domain-containing protein [Aquabacterium sp.]
MSAGGSSKVSGSKLVRRLMAVVYLGLFAAVALVWRSPSMSHWLDPVVLSQLGRDLLASPLGPLAVLGGYVLAVVLAMPILLMISVGTLVFGPWLGMVYSLVGMLSGAVVTYGVGRLSGAYLLDRFGDPQVQHLASRLKDRSLLAIIFLRAFPVAPFLVINVTAGALRVRFRDYVLGTVLGVLPGTILLSLFMDRLVAAWRNPGMGTYVGVALFLVALVTAARALRKRLVLALAAEPKAG